MKKAIDKTWIVLNKNIGTATAVGILIGLSGILVSGAAVISTIIENQISSVSARTDTNTKDVSDLKADVRVVNVKMDILLGEYGYTKEQIQAINDGKINATTNLSHNSK